MILSVDLKTQRRPITGGKPCKPPHLCESCGDVYLYDDRHECSECEERGVLAEREALELNVEDNPNWKEKEEWSDIPVLQPITTKVRQLNPEAWK